MGCSSGVWQRGLVQPGIKLAPSAPGRPQLPVATLLTTSCGNPNLPPGPAWCTGGAGLPAAEPGAQGNRLHSADGGHHPGVLQGVGGCAPGCWGLCSGVSVGVLEGVGLLRSTTYPP